MVFRADYVLSRHPQKVTGAIYLLRRQGIRPSRRHGLRVIVQSHAQPGDVLQPRFI